MGLYLGNKMSPRGFMGLKLPKADLVTLSNNIICEANLVTLGNNIIHEAGLFSGGKKVDDGEYKETKTKKNTLFKIATVL